MAFFKFRKGGDAQKGAKPVPATPSIEVLRRRARHRLVGAAILVLLGVIGFPLVFDSQPRPIAVDIPIDIPDKAKVKPLLDVPASQASGAVQSAAGVVSAPAVVTPPVHMAAQPTETVISPAAPKEAAPVQAASVPKPASVAASKPLVAPEPRAKLSPEGAKALALLEGKAASTAAGDKFVVQVGAFSDEAKVYEARTKLERSGLKTYTQVVQTSAGKRTRVRVGPFTSRAQADKAAAKIKKLALPASVLTL